MICFETEVKLAEVLLRICNSERLVEENRFLLSSNESFDPFTTFKAVDRLGIGTFSATDLLTLLDTHHIHCSTDEAYLSIKQYDTSQHGRLSINEFFQLVLTSTCPPLRARAQSRSGSYSSEIESLFLNLLQSEVNFHRTAEAAKRNLILQHDFSILECFRAIDIRNQSFIDRKTLLDFLRRHRKVDEVDVDAVFRRLDNDGDDLLTYQEFVESVMPSQLTGMRGLSYSVVSLNSSMSNSYVRNPTRGNSPIKDSSIRNSPTRTMDQMKHSVGFNQSNRSSPMKASVQYSTFESSMRASNNSIKRGSPLRSLRHGLKSEKNSVRNSTLNVSSRSFNQTNLSAARRGSPLRRSSPQKLTPRSVATPLTPSIEEQEIVNWFQEEIKLSRDVEKKKNELALRHDFNLIDAFSLFDKNDSGSINIQDFEETLEYLDFPAPRDEVFLLVKHFSQAKNGRMTFADFSEMVSPKQVEYARILRNRSPNSASYADQFVFQQDTVKILIEMFGMLLDCESLAERVRQRLGRMPNFSFHQAFMALDRARNGFISIDDFQSILQSHGIFESNKNLKNDILNYEKNYDGRVSYSNFMKQITPQSPRRF